MSAGRAQMKNGWTRAPSDLFIWAGDLPLYCVEVLPEAPWAECVTPRPLPMIPKQFVILSDWLVRYRSASASLS